MFYISIFLFWFAVFLNMNRIFNTKVKRLIDTAQLCSLVLYYRHVHSTVTTKALNVFDAYNFNYFNSLVCTPSGPPQNC